METQDSNEKWLDYLYGEMSESDRSSFERELKADPALAEELSQMQGLRQAYQSHLPELSVPAGLRSKMLREIGVKRSWREMLFGQGWMRPAMVGAFAFVLTLGISYELRDKDTNVVPPVAKLSVPAAPAVPSLHELSPQDFFAAAKARPQTPRWNWRPAPTLNNGLVTLASYGSNSTMPQYYGEASAFDIPQIEQDSDMAIAQFSHQQALRMRARGDLRGAAQELAKLIKQYPQYPQVFAAAAQRIDCLFRLGDQVTAKRELAWLGQQSPFLAQLVGQRWGM